MNEQICLSTSLLTSCRCTVFPLFVPRAATHIVSPRYLAIRDTAATSLPVVDVVVAGVEAGAAVVLHVAGVSLSQELSVTGHFGPLADRIEPQAVIASGIFEKSRLRCPKADVEVGTVFTVGKARGPGKCVAGEGFSVIGSVPQIRLTGWCGLP